MVSRFLWCCCQIKSDYFNLMNICSFYSWLKDESSEMWVGGLPKVLLFSRRHYSCQGRSLFILKVHSIPHLLGHTKGMCWINTHTQFHIHGCLCEHGFAEFSKQQHLVGNSHVWIEALKIVRHHMHKMTFTIISLNYLTLMLSLYHLDSRCFTALNCYHVFGWFTICAHEQLNKFIIKWTVEYKALTWTELWLMP